MTSRFLPSSQTTASTALSDWNAASPARSPSFILETSILISPSHCGPIMRCVSVLRARKMFGATFCALSRIQPGRSTRDHAPSSGLWFHCHLRSSVFFLKPSDPTMPESDGYGLVKSLGIFPSRLPRIGHPSFHVTPIRHGILPRPPRSWNTIARHFPSGHSTTHPCPTPPQFSNSVSSMTFFSHSPSRDFER